MKRILIISKYIAPVHSIASIRWTKLAKYLSEQEGYLISVLTEERTFDGADAFSRDPLLERDMRVFRHYHVVPPGRWLMRYGRAKDRHSVYVKPEAANPQPEPSGAKRAVYELAHDVKDYIQHQDAVRYLKAHPDVMDTDIIISSYGPLWVHMTAEWIKRHNPRAMWIADYRDLFCTEAMPAITRRYRHGFARRHTAAAELVTTVSGEMFPFLELPKDQRRLVLANGFDPAEALPPLSAERFTLLYTGKLYRDGDRLRDLRPVFSALRALLEGGVMSPNDLVLQYAGNDGGLFLAQAAECGMEGFVDDRGMVGRDAVAQLRQRAAALLLCTWNTEGEKGVLTGKLYEYMQARKPIFAVCTGDSPNSELRDIIQAGRLGCCCETCVPETLAELKEALVRAYRTWRRDGTAQYSPDAEFVERYTHPYLARLLHRAITERWREK